MVFLNCVKFAEKRFLKIPRNQIIDSLKLRVQGGHGGNGLPKYGGIGGQGGCVYFVAKKDTDLKKIIHKYRSKIITAGHGENSSKDRLLGRRGVDKRVEVPIGLTVYDENHKLIGELNEEGSHCIGAGGGGGGCSGNSFLGHSGQDREVMLDLKLIADVGLIGFPNAGKSTLLKAISNASPKIASYPFTTLRPQIGIIDYKDHRQISLADLPGLIEGAHINIGMGHEFLKHVERTRLLLMVVDIFGFRLSPAHPQRTCLENILALNKELELYDKSLMEKPCILLINKMDADDSKEILNETLPKLTKIKDLSAECPEEFQTEKFIHFDRIISISAKENFGIDYVKQAVRDVLDEHAETMLEPEQVRKK